VVGVVVRAGAHTGGRGAEVLRGGRGVEALELGGHEGLLYAGEQVKPRLCVHRRTVR